MWMTASFALTFSLSAGEPAPPPPAAAAAEVDECKDPQTQLALNSCAARDAHAAEAARKAAAKELALLVDKKQLAKMRAAEKAFEAYRDADCAFMAAQYEGGSIQPMIMWKCVQQQESTRADRLRLEIEDYKPH